MPPATKIFSILAVALLAALSFGFSPINLGAARLLVFISAVYLLIAGIRGKEQFWTIFFAVVAVLFNPVHEVLYLSRNQWRIFDLLIAGGIALFFYRYYNGYAKGRAFEKFVLSMLPESEWVIEDWTKDKSKRLRRQVESDKNPDLTVRNKKTGERIAIECKFRSRTWVNKFGINGISWNPYSHEFYKRYGQKEGIPVKVVFGLGGNPKSPDKIFVVPLERLEEFKGKSIPLKVMENFETNTEARLAL